MQIKDYTGYKQPNGLLTAVERLQNYQNKGRTYYKCKCECGNITYVLGSNFSSEHTISCGCKSSRNGTQQFDFLHQYRFDSKDKIYKIYKHTSPSNKVYIGMTKQKVTRRSQNGYGYKTQRLFYNAIQKYGWDSFQHEILECNLTHDEACEKEQHYIKLYKSNDPNFGYNVTFGGDGCKDRGKPVVQILNGKVVNVFVSYVDASQKLEISDSSIYNYTRDNLRHGGYIFKRISNEEYQKLKHICNKKHLNGFRKLVLEEKSNISRNRKNKISICKYSLDGKYIGKYKGINEAIRITNIGNIAYALSHENSQAGGFMWRYDNGDYSNIKPYKGNNHNAKAVLKIDKLNNEILRKYGSMVEAEKDTGITFKMIWKACNNNVKTAGGYIWKYAD